MTPTKEESSSPFFSGEYHDRNHVDLETTSPFYFVLSSLSLVLVRQNQERTGRTTQDSTATIRPLLAARRLPKNQGQ